MSFIDQPFQSSLTKMLGQSNLNDEEIKSLRRKAWREQSVLLVTPWDRRLSQNEAKLICQIGERLHGGE